MKPLRLIACCSLLLLSACVTQTPRISGGSTARSVSELRDWTATGRIGVSSPEQSGSGGFTWTQQASASKVQLRGPVGVGSLVITSDGKNLSIQSSDGTQYDADAALAELQARLGAAIPVQQLRYWILGIAAPGAASNADASGNVLQQAGWRIEYGDWLQRDGLRLPAKLTLTREQLRIVMVVQSWQLES
ncbi:MAG: lipoprotein insertase outer membrane protein LolB [Steroidobacteraceae bacterium]